jgi:ABC-type branched-subunit amino acid transport system ATPase component
MSDSSSASDSRFDMSPPAGLSGGDTGADRTAGLAVDDLVIRSGGLVAVDHVSLQAPEGRLTALIGPNGAGKTSLFNACTGLLRPAGGRVSLFGTDLTGLPPAKRARLGLGRTFQRMELFDSMTVRENVSLGFEAGRAGRNPLRHLTAGRAGRAQGDAAVARAMAVCEVSQLADRRAVDLSTGQRRLVELARALAGDFRLLLLDEPSSGLDATETGQFGWLLRRLIATRGVGVLLVEHDMDLVLDVADHVHVLDFGKHIFAGTPDEVRASDAVRAAYLGAAA